MCSIWLSCLLRHCTTNTIRPHVHRIRTLNLRPDVAASYIPQFTTVFPKREPKLKNAVSRFLSRFLVNDSSPALVPGVTSAIVPSSQAIRYAKSASDLISNMSNVEELNVEELWGLGSGDTSPFGLRRICCAPRRDLKDLEFIMQTVIGTGWATFGSTLRCLKLNLPHYCYYVSAMPKLVFPCLQELDITLSAGVFLRDRVVPFINDHHSTLQSLKLSFDKVVPMDDLDACLYLPQIRCIPNLSTLHFYYYTTTELDLDTSGLHTFLSTHSTGLRALRLNLLSDLDFNGQFNLDDRYSQPIFHIALPCLELLELGSGCCTNLQMTATYLQQYAHSLKYLKLEHAHLAFQEVKILLTVLAEHDNLRSLSIYVRYLTPELLDLLAKKLPSLDHLYVMYQHAIPWISFPITGNLDAELVSVQLMLRTDVAKFCTIVLS